VVEDLVGIFASRRAEIGAMEEHEARMESNHVLRALADDLGTRMGSRSTRPETARKLPRPVSSGRARRPGRESLATFSHLEPTRELGCFSLGKEEHVSVLIVAEQPGGNAVQDDAVMKALDLTNNPPSGSHIRMAGPMDGGWRVIALWDSRAQFDAFMQDRLRPALEGAGLQPPKVSFWDIEKVNRWD
jgi:hypothetical protein